MSVEPVYKLGSIHEYCQVTANLAVSMNTANLAVFMFGQTFACSYSAKMCSCKKKKKKKKNNDAEKRQGPNGPS